MKVYGSGLSAPNGELVPLSLAVEEGELLFFSGQLALKKGIIQGDIEEQTTLIFDTLEIKLAELALTLDNVVKATIWLTNPSDFSRFNAVYRKRMSEPFPARSCVVSSLVLPGALIEIEIVASRAHRRA
ncbi:MAG: RidA family protein [Caulobacteraceae bacterium]